MRIVLPENINIGSFGNLQLSRKTAEILTQLAFPIALLIIMLPLVLFKVNGSSIGTYNSYFYGSNIEDDSLIFGQPRAIRSDEWLVQTPWTISEYKLNFNQENTLYLGKQNFTLTDVPVRNWTILFKPQHWSFFLLPLESAFSLKWWFRSYLLIISAYIVLIYLTNKNIPISALGSLSFFFSPFFQWWYSTTAVDLTTYGLLTFFFFVKLLMSQDTRKLLIFAILFAYFSICFAFLVYPPFQISIALFFGFCGVGFILSNKCYFSRAPLKKILLAVGLSFALIISVIFFYLLSFKDIINIFLNTAYPGARRVVGGDLSPLQLFGGFFNIQLLDNYKKVPDVLHNQSEASSFFMLSLFVIPVILFYVIRFLFQEKKLDLLLASAFFYYAIAIAWSFFGLPEIVAKILLLNLVPTQRMVLVFGFMNFFFITYFLFRFKININQSYQIFVGIYGFLIFLFYLWLGNFFKINYPSFIQNSYKILAISLSVSVLLVLILLQRHKPFFIILFAFSVFSTYRVNPLYIGLAPIIKSDLSLAIEQIQNGNDQNDSWVVYENLILANFIAANGAKVINGTYLYPNLDMWHNLDPGAQFEDIYNRYSHIIFQAVDGNEITFSVVQGDVISVNVSPCNKSLQTLGIDYFVFPHRTDYACLKSVKTVEYPALPIYIYERIEHNN